MSFPGEGGPDGLSGNARQVRLMLDDAARKRLGVALDQIISGSMGVLVTDIPGGQHYDLDMRKARLTLPGLGWSKGVGVPATLSFDLKPNDQGYSVEGLKLTGDGFGLTGTAALDKTYGLLSADIDHLSLRSDDSISIRMVRGPHGFGISARGASLDLRGLMTHIRDNNSQAGGFPDLALDAAIDKLIGFNQETVTNAKLTLVSIGGSTQKISFRGTLGDSQVSLDYGVTPTATTIKGTATDAGQLLRFTDLYTRMAGGQLTIDGQGGPEGPLLGNIDLASFDVLNEPAIRQLSPNGNAAGRSSPDLSRVQFERLVARFRQTKGTIAIEDALLRSVSIGATFSGRYDMPTSNVAITGTYLPAYSFNNLFGRIPLLGLALGGGSREGLIGVTFKIEGPIADPRILINPLSVVAPGIFRKIFEFQ
jgi:hypothetical protein